MGQKFEGKNSDWTKRTPMPMISRLPTLAVNSTLFGSHSFIGGHWEKDPGVNIPPATNLLMMMDLSPNLM